MFEEGCPSTQGIADEKADATLDSKTERMEHQLRAAGVFRDRQAAAAKKVKEELVAVEGQVKELEGALQRCGCA